MVGCLAERGILMTNEEVIRIMAMLGAFYGAGKSNPEVMADGWSIVLEPYEFRVAYNAVIEFARNDTREYGTFPTVGNIVKYIEAEMSKEQEPINEVVRAISYGWKYDQLSTDARALITNGTYDDWLKMDAEEFANKAGVLAGTLKKSRKRLKGETE